MIRRQDCLWQIKFDGFDRLRNIEIILLVFDDSCEEIYNDKEFVKLATAGRHRGLDVIYVEHNLFQQSRWSRTFDLNTSYILLFKSPRDIQQLDHLGRQLNAPKFLRQSYELATKDSFGHLLLDLDPRTSDCLRYCSNIIPSGPSIFYLPLDKAEVTPITNEREKLFILQHMVQLNPTQLRGFIIKKHQIVKSYQLFVNACSM